MTDLNAASGSAKVCLARSAVTTQRSSGLSVLLLERSHATKGCCWYRGADAFGRVQEIWREERTCPPLPPHARDALLGEGASFQEVADILGNTEAVVRKHYGKWSKQRQANIDRLMIKHFDSAQSAAQVAHESHENSGAVN
jgi:hypothetical protein